MEYSVTDGDTVFEQMSMVLEDTEPTSDVSKILDESVTTSSVTMGWDEENNGLLPYLQGNSLQTRMIDKSPDSRDLLFSPRSMFARMFNQIMGPKKRRIQERVQAIHEYYTDIFTHTYDPYDGTRLAVGTTTGQLNILSQSPSRPPKLEQRIQMDYPRPFTGLHWSASGLAMASGKYLYFYRTNTNDMTIDTKPYVKFTILCDILDACMLSACTENAVIICDTGKALIYDLQVEKLSSVLRDHRSTATVCRQSVDFLATGGTDGNVFVYDAKLRSPRPIWSFQHQNPIRTLAISREGTFIAISEQGRNSPSVYNLRAGFDLGAVKMPEQLDVNSVAIDDYGGTYWGGTNGILYYAENFSSVHRKLQASYSDKKIRCINSITLPPHKCGELTDYVSIAGGSNSVLISSRGCGYWEYMVHLIGESLVLAA